MRCTSHTVPASRDLPATVWTHATSRYAVLVDGDPATGVDAGADAGCRHGQQWYTQTLGDQITGLLGRGSRPLGLVVADAIAATAGQHRSCDLRNPASPHATVAIMRADGLRLEWLLLGETAVIVDDGREKLAWEDLRVEQIPDQKASTLARYRNRPTGYWVAQADPGAAKHAVVESTVADRVRRAAVCSAGVARLPHRYGWTWQRVLDGAQGRGVRWVCEQAHDRDVTGRPSGRARGARCVDAALILAEGVRS